MQAIFQANPKHPGLVAALSWVQNWIDSANAGDQETPALVDMQRLSTHGVTALDILTEVTAVHVWQATKPQPLPSLMAVDYALSRCVLNLAPRGHNPHPITGKPVYVQFRAHALRSIGPRFRQTLPAFLSNVRMAIEGQQERLEAMQDAFRQPLAVSPSMALQCGTKAAPTRCGNSRASVALPQ